MVLVLLQCFCPVILCYQAGLLSAPATSDGTPVGTGGASMGLVYSGGTYYGSSGCAPVGLGCRRFCPVVCDIPVQLRICTGIMDFKHEIGYRYFGMKTTWARRCEVLENSLLL